MEQTHTEWLSEQRAASTMVVTPVPLSEVAKWGLQKKGDLEVFGHQDGAFFTLEGRHIRANREVAGWDQPIVVEKGNGVVILVGTKGGERFLLQATAESGNDPNDGFVLLRPTLQASRSNLEAAHGGKRPPRAELYDRTDVRWAEPQPQDGGRFENKKVGIGVLLMEDEEFDSIELLPNERVFTMKEVTEAVLSGDCVTHLRDAILLATIFNAIADKD